jgi:transcriptional regulator with XRE-family HTH domain
MKEKSGLLENHLKEKREETGIKIREIREQRGLSQEQLAELMGINRSTLSKIETGKFAITIDYLFRLAWHLDFDIAILDKLYEKRKMDI